MNRRLAWKETGRAVRRAVLLVLLAQLAGSVTVWAGYREWTNLGPLAETVNALVIDPSSPSTLYVGTPGRGVLKSTDGGGTWTAANNGLQNLFVNVLAIHPSHPSTLYTGSFKTTDGGLSWAAANNGLPTSLAVLAIDPSNPSTVYAGMHAGGGLGLYKSTDGGMSWFAASQGLPNRTVDALAVHPSNSSIVYAGSRNSGVFKSTDAGKSWSAAGLASVAVTAMTMDPSNPSTLYAGAPGGIFKTTDGGTSWKTASSGLPAYTSIVALVIDPSNPSTLYAGTTTLYNGIGQGVFRSTDGGASWSALNSGLTTLDVQTLAIDPQDPGHLYAGTSRGGVFVISFGVPPPFAVAGQVLSGGGGSGSLSLTFPPGYAWTASTSDSWLTLNGPATGAGSGTLTFQATANGGTARSGTITVAGFSFTIEQQAGSIPGLNFIGSMPHIAAGENWTTGFTLINKSTEPAQARLNLFSDPAGALMLPLTFPQLLPAPLPLLADSLDRALSANASLVIETAGPKTPPAQAGSAQVAATNNIDGFAIFRHVTTAQEVAVPLERREESSYLLAFDHTNGAALGVALQNISAQAANVPVVIRDDAGTVISAPGTTLSLAANGHTSFELSPRYPFTANKRGTIEFGTPAGGKIGVLGIRFTQPSNALTFIPALAPPGTSGGSFAHVASGGDGWQTTFVLVNAGGSAASATLRFFGDNGNPLSLPLSFPQSGNGTATVASSITQTLGAGATFMVQSTTSGELLTGSAQLRTAGNIDGFVILRHNGQEAVVPLESRGASAYIMAFDNTKGAATGVAINSVFAQPADIPLVVRDDRGAIIASDTISLAANGHYAFTLVKDKYPVTANIRGTIEFAVPFGGQIGALAIRIPLARTFTSLPVLVK